MTKEQLTEVHATLSALKMCLAINRPNGTTQLVNRINGCHELIEADLKSDPTALDLIAAEREKQISKGYTVEHDAAYVERTKITFDMIAINLINRYQCPPEWNQGYWDGLCNLPRPDRLRIAATWFSRELERVIYVTRQKEDK